MHQIEKIYEASASTKQFAELYLDYLSGILKKLDTQAIGQCMEWILEARERGAQIFFIGNGGSAATASHMANDIGVGTRSKSKPFRALALTDNIASISAIANDYSYEEIFSKQLEIFAQKGDLLIAISASGNSPNILRGVERAKSLGLKTIGLTGFDGGKLRTMCDLNLHVPSTKGEYGPVEDVHMIFDHLMGAYLMQRCQREL